MTFLPLFASGFSLGTSSFSWTTDESESYRILDFFVSMGGVLVDTADMYGESEKYIGTWKRQNPEVELLISTKVGGKIHRQGLTQKNVKRSLSESLERLGISQVEIYFCHQDDLELEIEEIFQVFLELKEEGLINFAGVSNFNPSRLEQLFSLQNLVGKPVFKFVQAPYNLIDRRYFEEDLLPILQSFEVYALPFYPLAKGFLAGEFGPFDSRQKYGNAHGGIGVGQYKTIRNFRLLNRIRRVANKYECTMAEISLAWLRQQASVLLPICGFRNLAQIQNASKAVILSKFDLNYLTNFKNNQIKLYV
jgi:aryl-alcohol dehydrogenase-like predicted oxidoreductase